MCDCLEGGLSGGCVKRLGAVCKVGGEKSKGVGMEVEFVFEFVEEFFV